MTADLNKFFFKSLRPFIWLLLVCVAIYVPTLAFDYVTLDDDRLIRDNMEFLQNPSNLGQVFSSHYFKPESVLGFYYRPLVTLSYMIDAIVGSGEPWIFHFTNTCLHWIVSCMVFWMLVEVSGLLGVENKPLAFLGALFFATHPAQVMAVAWIAGRNDILFSLFALPSIISYVRHDRTLKYGYQFLHLIFFFLALITKELAVGIPVICIVLTAISRRATMPSEKIVNFVKEIIKRVPLLGWIGVGLLWMIIRGLALGIAGFAGGGMLVSAHSLPTACALLLRYLGKTMLPFNLKVIPTLTATSSVYGAVIILVLIFLWIFLSASNRRAFIFSCSWFFLFLLFSLPFSQEGDVENLGLLEHRLYFPMAGWTCLFLCAPHLWKNVQSGSKTLGYCIRGLIVALVISVFTSNCILTIRRLPAFAGSISFWETAVAQSPRSDLTNMGLAVMYLRDNRLEEAKKLLDIVKEINPEKRYVHQNLGSYYHQKKMFDQAETEYLKEVELYPESMQPYACLALLMDQTGRHLEARDWRIKSSVMKEAILRHLRHIESADPVFQY